ncbi:MAG TPA: sugar phosphate nucleotidyltransferase [Thermoanaerobaculia bacterium]
MILAAGYGTRLRPITYTMPKPMVPLGGRPLIGRLVDRVIQSGSDEIVVNVHHFPGQIRDYLSSQFNIRFHFSHEPEILGTGGGVRKVRSILDRDEDFFLMNGDTYSEPRFDDLRRARRDRHAISAMTLRHPPAGDRYTAVWEEGGIINGFGKGHGEALMFSGSHCISSEIFRYIPDRDVSDLTGDVYVPLTRSNEPKIAAVVDDNPMWFDIGTPQRYLTASRALGAMIGQSVIEGDVHDCVVWDDCFIGRGVTLEGCIVAHGVELRGGMHFKNALICRDDPRIPRDSSYRFADGLVIAPI